MKSETDVSNVRTSRPWTPPPRWPSHARTRTPQHAGRARRVLRHQSRRGSARRTPGPARRRPAQRATAAALDPNRAQVRRPGRLANRRAGGARAGGGSTPPPTRRGAAPSRRRSPAAASAPGARERVRTRRARVDARSVRDGARRVEGTPVVAVRARPPRTRSFKGDFERGATWAFFVGVRAEPPGTRARGRSPRPRVSLSEPEDDLRAESRARRRPSRRERRNRNPESESVEKETEKERAHASSERRSASSRSRVSAAARRAAAAFGFFRESHRLSREKLARVKYAVVGAPPRSRRGAGRHPPRGAKTRRSPQSMKPTISFGARRA